MNKYINAEKFIYSIKNRFCTLIIERSGKLVMVWRKFYIQNCEMRRSRSSSELINVSPNKHVWVAVTPTKGDEYGLAQGKDCSQCKYFMIEITKI